MSFLNISEPAELHAAVRATNHALDHPAEATAKEQRDAQAYASARANAYAIRNVGLTQGAAVDPWLDRVLTRYTETDHLVPRDLPRRLGQAAIVTLRPDDHYFRRTTDENGTEALHEWIYCYPLPADGGPLQPPRKDACDRCASEFAREFGFGSVKPLRPVHVARFDVVVEMMLCVDCRASIGLAAGATVAVATATKAKQ